MLVDTKAVCPEVKVSLAACHPLQNLPHELSGLDWQKLQTAAEHHGVLPLVWEAVRKYAAGRQSLAFQQEAEEYGKRQLKLSAILMRLLNAFAERNIPVLPYKGPVFAQQLYGNVALRQSIDLDIVVPYQDVKRARKLLADIGFVPTLHLSAEQERFLQTTHCEAEFYSESADVVVELHWAALPCEFGVMLPSPDAFTRCATVEFFGRTIRVPHPEEAVLWITAHGAKHCWSRLIFLADFARAISAPGIDYDSLLARAKAARCFRMLELALSLSRELVGFTPKEFPATDLDEPPRNILKQIATRLLSEVAVEPSASERHRFAIALADNRYQAARYCWKIIRNPQPADFQTMRLPRPLFLFYTGIRFARLASKALRSLVHHRQSAEFQNLQAKAGGAE